MRRHISFVATAALLAACAGVVRAADAPPPRGSTLPPRTAPRAPLFPPPEIGSPFHGASDGLAIGGYGELRLAEDREAGASDPEWFSVGAMNGFILAHVAPRIDFAIQGGWDRGADDFTLERTEVLYRFRGLMQAHAGIFLAPLGRTNLTHDAPSYDFAERSLVATQIIGVPNAEFGIGVKKGSDPEKGSRLSYEVDLVTGYNDGLVMDSPGGTRVPRGRNNYADQNGIPALAWRVALRSSPESEIGIAAQSGQYNRPTLNGVKVDNARWVHVVVVDGMRTVAGLRMFGEAAYAAIDVPPGLQALFAERQCGASVEAVRTLFDPLFGGWKGSMLTAALRADAVDFDRSIQGDSRSRLSASLNLYHRPLAVTRFGWYYEIRRDRFNNATPLAGVTLTAATYF